MGGTVEQVYQLDDPGPGTWRQVVGVSAIVAAAVCSVLFATPTMTEPPSTDSSCQLDLVRQEWTGSSCAQVEAESAATR